MYSSVSWLFKGTRWGWPTGTKRMYHWSDRWDSMPCFDAPLHLDLMCLEIIKEFWEWDTEEGNSWNDCRCFLLLKICKNKHKEKSECNPPLRSTLTISKENSVGTVYIDSYCTYCGRGNNNVINVFPLASTVYVCSLQYCMMGKYTDYMSTRDTEISTWQCDYVNLKKLVTAELDHEVCKLPFLLIPIQTWSYWSESLA